MKQLQTVLNGSVEKNPKYNFKGNAEDFEAYHLYDFVNNSEC